MLMKPDDISRCSHTTVGKLGNMHKTVLVHPYVYECSKVGDIGHDAWQFHSFYKVF